MAAVQNQAYLQTTIHHPAKQKAQFYIAHVAFFWSANIQRNKRFIKGVRPLQHWMLRWNPAAMPGILNEDRLSRSGTLG
jgi:hypothetical protein